MPGEPLLHAIAQRRYDGIGHDGVRHEVVVTIGQPVSDPRVGGDWSCAYQIQGIGNDLTSKAYGVDAIQALWLTLQKVGMELRHIMAARQMRLTWLDDDEIGLP